MPQTLTGTLIWLPPAEPLPKLAGLMLPPAEPAERPATDAPPWQPSGPGPSTATALPHTSTGAPIGALA